MALSQAPNRTASKQHRKPDKHRVLETYYHEKRKKEWGAFSRTAEVHHLSVESIRRYVKAAEEPVAPPVDAELQYQPAPGEKPVAPRIAPHLPQNQRRPRPKCHTIFHSRSMQQSGLLRQPVRSKVQKVKDISQNQPFTFHSAERETVPLDTGKLPHVAVPRTYPKRPAPRPAHARVVERIRAHVNPYMLLALAAVALLVLAVQYVR